MSRAVMMMSPTATTEPPTPAPRNEWLETLSRIKATQPRRFAREVGASLARDVERYEALRPDERLTETG